MKCCCNEPCILWQIAALVPIDVTMYGGRVQTCEEAGAGGCADWILTMGVGEGNALDTQPIEVGRSNGGIAECVNRIKVLLIGTDL